MSQTKFNAHPIIISAFLGLGVFAVFSPVRHFDFVNFDDDKYVLTNPWVRDGLSYEGMRWAFTSTYASNWHPLTWLSHMLDVQLFGMNAGGHHLTSVGLHAANVCLLFLILRRMTGACWRSAFVAALFGLHPLHVESVAWVAERKDILSAFFFMLTLLTYSRYVESKIQNARSKMPWYVITLVLFALGLMSKPMLVTLPFVLLLIDYWPLERIEFRTQNSKREAVSRLVLEKLPFLALSVASGIVTFLAQKEGGAVASLERVSFEARLMNAAVSYLAYLQKAFWPGKLAVLYLPPGQWPFWHVGLAVTLILGVTWVVVRMARSQPYMVVGWLWYLGMLVPVIGLIQVGNQAMADRYTYLPLIGIFLMMAWGCSQALGTSRPCKRVVTAGATLLITLAAVGTHRQLQFWQDGEKLFGHCVQVTSRNYIAHNNLGTALLKKRRYEEARIHFLESLEIAPNYADALKNMGVMLTQSGEIQEAEKYLREGIRLSPESADIYGKLAFALSAQGKFQSAIEYYRECLRLKPDQAEAYNNLAWILATNPEATLRDGSEAVRAAETACRLTGYKTGVVVGTLAAAYAEAGRFDEAVAAAEKARALATTAGEIEVARKNQELIELYRAGKPYREK